MKQQRLLPYFFVTREFNCLFLFGESAYVNYAPLCLRKIRVKNIFQHKHKHFDRMQTWEVYRPTNPHLSALPLAHRRKLNICLFSPLLLQNLASLSNFSFFFFFFFWSGLGFPRHSRIQFTACVFFCFFFFYRAESFSCRRLWDSSHGTEGLAETAAERASVIFRPDRWDCSLDPCAKLPGCLIEVHHTWEHQRLASIEIISWPRELLAFEL